MSICQLCGSKEGITQYVVAPKDEEISICSVCAESIEDPTSNEKHWNCLHDSMWSTEPAVQVMAFRLLTKLGAQDQLDMMYMENDVKAWAEAGIDNSENVIHKDSNGVTLSAGDTVVITKDLDVKGTTFVAKRGTAVRNIGLVKDNAELIEGRVNGVKIQILTKFLKKS